MGTEGIQSAFPFFYYILCMKIPGLSFSWKRALGITQAKQQIARKTGIPMSKQGIERKVGKTIIKGIEGLLK